MFFVGLHQPSDAKHFERAFVSVNRLREVRRGGVVRWRSKPLGVAQWIMDSGAFTEISTHGRYRSSVEQYAETINRYASDPALIAAVAQDYMCEPFILEKTGLTVEQHQALTVERYDALVPLVRRVYVMPVLQGYAPEDYVRHLAMYGERLRHGMWVGVGSICKRNSNVAAVEAVLAAIRRVRPDLRLHGFGLKLTALASSAVRDALWSADSMAWSFSARKQGRSANDWGEAKNFFDKIDLREAA